jgi:hypothetical protein
VKQDKNNHSHDSNQTRHVVSTNLASATIPLPEMSSSKTSSPSVTVYDMNGRSSPVLPAIDKESDDIDKIARPKNMNLFLPHSSSQQLLPLPETTFLLFNPHSNLTSLSTNRTIMTHIMQETNSNVTSSIGSQVSSPRNGSGSEMMTQTPSYDSLVHRKHRKHHRRHPNKHQHRHHNNSQIPQLTDIPVPNPPKAVLLYNRCSGGHIQIKENKKKNRIMGSRFVSRRRQNKDFKDGKEMHEMLSMIQHFSPHFFLLNFISNSHLFHACCAIF